MMAPAFTGWVQWVAMAAEVGAAVRMAVGSTAGRAVVGWAVAAAGALMGAAVDTSAGSSAGAVVYDVCVGEWVREWGGGAAVALRI